MWGRGIEHKHNFTSVMFPTQQQLSSIYRQFIGYLGQGVPVITKLNLYLRLKNIYGHNF